MRIQIKNLKLNYAKDTKQSLSIDQYVIRAFSSPRHKKMTYSRTDIDFIMGINIESDEFAIIPVEKVPSSGIVKISNQCDRRQYFNSFKALEDFYIL